MNVLTGSYKGMPTRHSLIGLIWVMFSPAFVVILFTLILYCNAALADSDSLDSSLFGKPILRVEYSSDLPLNRAHYDPHIGIKTGEPLTRTGIKKAIQFLYDCGRFSRIAVEALPESNAVIVRFDLNHNYYFNRFFLEGKVDLKGRYLWELVSLPTGSRFTEDKLEESRQAVLSFMKERGLHLAKVQVRTLRDTTNRQIDVNFQVQPGELATIQSIDIAGVPPQRVKEILNRFGFQSGREYDRSRLNSRLENLRKYFLDKGYLAASVQVSESFDPDENAISLTLNVSNFGKMRVVIDGFKIDKMKLRTLLPVLSGEGADQDILDEGANNLKKYLESKGYSEAAVQVTEKTDKYGTHIFHHRIIPRRKFTVMAVRFEGNQALTSKELLSAIQMQPAVFQNIGFSSSQMEEAANSLRSLYESYGYQSAGIVPRIEPIKGSAKLIITFSCKEGLRSHVRSLSISGNAAFAAEDLKSKIQLSSGSPYSLSIVEKARQQLLSAYSDLGYLQAQILVSVGDADEAKSYPLEFKIIEGFQSFVDRLVVIGNERTRNSVLNKRVKLKENEPLSLSKLLQTQQGLYSLGIFDQVRVTSQSPDSKALHQDVVIRLQESKRYTLRYGVGYQEREKLRGTVEFTDLNVLGLARRADLRFRGSSIEQQVLFNLKQPQFRTIPVDSYFTFFVLRRKDVSFDSQRFGLSYQFSHPYGSNTWSMLRFNYKNVRILDSRVPTADLGREDKPVNLSTFSTAFIRDTRDDYLDPAKGFFSSTDFGITTKLLGDNNYLSFFTQNSYYRPLLKSLSFAGSIRIGAARPFGGDVTIPISERFFAGGSSSLRGFNVDYAGPLDPASNKPLGGNALVAASFEMRIPLYRAFNLAGFYDSGNVFRNVRDIHFSDFSHAVGLGLRIRTPFGPLRADYGYNLNLSTDLRQRGLTRGHLFITVGPPF
jgi:outer membrane protein insertion porin family